MAISSTRTNTRAKVDPAESSFYRQATLDALELSSVNDASNDMTEDYSVHAHAFLDKVTTNSINSKPFESKDIGFSPLYAGVTSSNMDDASSFMQYKQAAQVVLIETARTAGIQPELQNGHLSGEINQIETNGEFVQSKCEPSKTQKEDVTLKVDGVQVEPNGTVHDRLDNTINTLQQRVAALTQALDQTATYQQQREQMFSQADRKLNALQRNMEKQPTQQESAEIQKPKATDIPEQNEHDENKQQKQRHKKEPANSMDGLKNAAEQTTGAAMGLTAEVAKGLGNATRGIARFSLNATKYGMAAYQTHKGNQQLQQSALTMNSQTRNMEELPALLHRIDANVESITTANSGNEVFLNGKFKELSNDLKSLHQYHRRSLQQGSNLTGVDLNNFIKQRQKEVDMTNATLSNLNINNGQLQATADKIGFKIDLNNIKESISKAVDHIQNTLSSLKSRFTSAMSPSK